MGISPCRCHEETNKHQSEHNLLLPTSSISDSGSLLTQQPFSVHFPSPFFVHIIPNLVSKRLHGFFVLPLPQNIGDRRRKILQLAHLPKGDLFSCEGHHTFHQQARSQNLDQPTRPFKSGRDIPSSSQQASRTFIPFLFNPDSDRFRRFVPPQLMRFLHIFLKSLSKLSDSVLLLCIICQIFVLRLCGLPISRSHEYMYSWSSLHRLRSNSDACCYASSTFCCISFRS